MRVYTEEAAGMHSVDSSRDVCRCNETCTATQHFGNELWVLVSDYMVELIIV